MMSERIQTVLADYEEGLLTVQTIYDKHHIGHERMYDLIRENKVPLREGPVLVQKRLQTKMATKNETPFGIKITHSTQDVSVGDTLYDGIVIERKVIRKPTQEKSGFFEYKISYGMNERVEMAVRDKILNVA